MLRSFWLLLFLTAVIEASDLPLSHDQAQLKGNKNLNFVHNQTFPKILVWAGPEN
jgi:hypothetical protein